MSPVMLKAPPALRQAWGEETTDVFVAWLEGVLGERTISQDEHRQIISRLEILEHDLADVKADVRDLRREMNERFDRMNERFDRMNARFEERFDSMQHQMLVQTRWLIGSVGLIGTIITVLLAIAEFAP